EFAAVAAGVAYREPSAAGRREWMSPDYWVRQVREPVRYADALTHALTQAASGGFLVEIGPDGSLTSLARTSDHPVAAVTLSRREQPESVAVVAGLVELWTVGGPVTQAALAALIPGAATPGRVVPLPTYPFQRDRYWLAPTTTHLASSAGGAQAMMLAVDWSPLSAGHVGDAGRPSSAVFVDVVGLAALGEDLPEWLVLDVDPLAADSELDELVRVRVVLARVLEVLQEFTSGSVRREARLALVLRDAGDDPIAAAVAGLVRSAQAENPGRILLADLGERELDGDAVGLAEFAGLFGRAAAADEWEIRVRDGQAEIPGLTRAADGPLVTGAADTGT
ncbi:hypothetical protein MXD61_05680, partial [Frankia sp. AgPm24]|nr:hypothetical protein [Frankia sp. AgPm24]